MLLVFGAITHRVETQLQQASLNFGLRIPLRLLVPFLSLWHDLGSASPSTKLPRPRPSSGFWRRIGGASADGGRRSGAPSRR